MNKERKEKKQLKGEFDSLHKVLLQLVVNDNRLDIVRRTEDKVVSIFESNIQRKRFVTNMQLFVQSMMFDIKDKMKKYE